MMLKSRMKQIGSVTLMALLTVGAVALVHTAKAEEAKAKAPEVKGNPALEVPEKDWPALQKQQVWAEQKIDSMKLRSQWIKVPSGDRKINAWVVYPKQKKKTPVVIVLHEAMGMTHSTRLTAANLAKMGYVAIAADMASGLGPNQGDVNSFTEPGKVTFTLAHRTTASINADLNALGDYAKQLPESNGKLAMLGLSWGGGAAFRFVATEHREDLKAIFVFYDIGPPRETQKTADATKPISVADIAVPVYGFYPTHDGRTMTGVQPTKDAMAAAGKHFDAVVYENTDHAFLRCWEDPSNNNPVNGEAYKDAMQRVAAGLAKIR